MVKETDGRDSTRPRLRQCRDFGGPKDSPDLHPLLRLLPRPDPGLLQVLQGQPAHAKSHELLRRWSLPCHGLHAHPARGGRTVLWRDDRRRGCACRAQDASGHHHDYCWCQLHDSRSCQRGSACGQTRYLPVALPSVLLGLLPRPASRPVTRELRGEKFMKIISLAPEVL